MRTPENARLLSRRDVTALGIAAGAVLLDACGRPARHSIVSAADPTINAINGPADSGGLLPARSLTRKPRIIHPRFFAGETIRSIPTSQRFVVLTFDDGPDKVHERGIDQVLTERGYPGKAVFFFVGVNALSSPEVVQEMYEKGYEIGNHTRTHADYSVNGETAEIEPTQEILFNLTGEVPLFFRGAGGTMGGSITAELARLGMAYIWTDGDEQDYVSPRVSPATMNALFAHYLHPGYISLRHSGGTHNNTVAAMHDLITFIEQSGYVILSLREALELREDGVGPSVAPGFFNRLNNMLPHMSDNADGPIGFDLAADMQEFYSSMRAPGQ